MKLSSGDKQKMNSKNYCKIKSDKCSAMRKAFYGKSFIFIICFIYNKSYFYWEI